MGELGENPKVMLSSQTMRSNGQTSRTHVKQIPSISWIEDFHVLHLTPTQDTTITRHEHCNTRLGCSTHQPLVVVVNGFAFVGDHFSLSPNCVKQTWCIWKIRELTFQDQVRFFTNERC